jgi:FKBP-type peptidyl-prolyl cis-trans isomerase 2
MAIADGDFVEIDYTGTITDEKAVFDTTSEDIAKKNGLYAQGTVYVPVKICVGKNHIVAGIDKHLVGKDVGETYTLTVLPEEGFGQKNPKYIQLVGTDKFRKQRINPQPGLRVNIDGLVGTVKTVSGGRTVVDFNHPLSGRTLSYEVSVKRVVTDVAEQVEAMLTLLGIKAEKKIEGEKLVLMVPDKVSDEAQQKIGKAITDCVKGITAVSCETGTTTVQPKQ